MTGIVDNVKVLESIISAMPTRLIIKQLVKNCSKDGDSRVEVALEIYTGIRRKACFTCAHIVEPIVEKIIRKGAEIFKTSEKDLKQQFREPYWRKGVASTFKGVAKYGVRKPFTPGSPLLVVWDYTYKCNLKCKHCYSSAGNPHTNEMNTQQALETVKKLAEADVASIAFSGGEPLMRKDIYQVLKAARDYGIYIAIATNGTLITREVARKLRESGVKYVQISLDGAKPETHDSFRGLNGAFRKTIQGIENCIKEGLFVEVATTITKKNYSEVRGIIELCKKLGVPWLMAYNFIPTGRGREIVKLDLEPAEREKLLTEFIELTYNQNEITLLSTAPQYARISLQIAEEAESKKVIMPTHFCNIPATSEIMKIADFIGGCGAGRMYCAIEPDGSIQPCVFLPIKVGNILKDNLEELWDNNKVLNDLRDREKLKGACKTCRYKYVCGGCRARAYAYFGDYLAPDPGCILNEAYWREIVGK